MTEKIRSKYYDPTITKDQIKAVIKKMPREHQAWVLGKPNLYDFRGTRDEMEYVLMHIPMIVNRALGYTDKAMGDAVARISVPYRKCCADWWNEWLPKEQETIGDMHINVCEGHFMHTEAENKAILEAYRHSYTNRNDVDLIGDQ